MTNVSNKDSDITSEGAAEENAPEENFSAPKIVSRPAVLPDAKKPERQPKPTSGTVRVVAINFHRAGKIYDFDCGDLELKAKDPVIVETDEGLGFATVVIAPRKENWVDLDHNLKKVIRKANYDDMKQRDKNKEREARAFQEAHRKIRAQNLAMKLVHVDYLHSGSKVVFFFTSENRVDFRNLVRELAQELHTRIEMKQIGPRDETKMIGGIGVCGRELCCTTWLRDFDPISIKMAKAQDLSLNPSKLAGQCGRLKCCLAYEYEVYDQTKRGMPRIGKKMCWKDGTSCGRVTGHHIFLNSVKVELDDGTEKLIPVGDIVEAPRLPAMGSGGPSSAALAPADLSEPPEPSDSSDEPAS